MGIFKEIPKSDGSGITTFYRISQYRATAEADNDDTTETMFDYNSALNKPSINNVALVGNKTLEDLGIQPADDYALKTEVPTKVSQLENDLDYATEAFVIAQISSAEHFHREIVDVLPDVGKDNVLYLLKKTGKQGDFYDEYLWMNPGYEFIGTTATDLSDYYKKAEVDDLLDKKVDKVAGKELSTNDYTTSEKTKLASLENYDDANLWNAVNALHNYDDTEIKADIAALESQMEGANSEIEVLDEKIEYQITLIRLIRHGDEWIWENTKNDILTFQDAFNQLGNPDVLLCLENVESDGKVYPSYYNAEDDYVRVYYLDKEHAIHLLSVSAMDATDTILGEDVVYQPKVDSVEKLPAVANKGEVRLVGDDDAVYIYDGSKWVPIDKGTSIDLSNYLPKDNTIAFNPTGNYNPATKKYVDDKVGALFIPTKVSQLTNDSQFIGKNTSDLTNYYVKNKLYTRAEVDALIQSGYTLPVATETTLGGVRIGDNLTIDETGKLSALGGEDNPPVYYTPEGTSDNPFIFEKHEPGVYFFAKGLSASPYVKWKESDTSTSWLSGSGIYFIWDTDTTNTASRNVGVCLNFGYNSGLAGIDYSSSTGKLTYGRTSWPVMMTTNNAQTISALKTFTVLPVSDEEVTLENQFVTKKYVDDSIPTVPTNLSEFTNDTNFITANDVPAKRYDILGHGASFSGETMGYDEIDVPLSTGRSVPGGTLVKSFNGGNSITLNGWKGLVRMEVSFLNTLSCSGRNGVQLFVYAQATNASVSDMQDGLACIDSESKWDFPKFTYYLYNSTGNDVTVSLSCMVSEASTGTIRLHSIALQEI